MKWEKLDKVPGTRRSSGYTACIFNLIGGNENEATA